MFIKFSKKAISVVVGMSLVMTSVPLSMIIEPASAEAAQSLTVVATRAATGKLVMKTATSYKLKVSATKGSRISYKSSKPSIVAVTKKGVLKARKTGKAVISITAKKGKKSAKKRIKVSVVKSRKFKRVKRLNAKVPSQTLTVGSTVSIRTTFKPVKASNRNVFFRSSNTRVATVSRTGKVAAKSPGTAKITVTSCDNAKAKKTVRITVVRKKSAHPSPAKPEVLDPQPRPNPTPLPVDRNESDVEVGEPEPINPNHENIVDYNDGVKFIDGDEWSTGIDGDVIVGNPATAQDLQGGDVVVLSPTNDEPQGRAIIVDNIEPSTGEVKSSEAKIFDVYDAIDVETVGGVEPGGFVPESGVEIESVEAVDVNGPFPTKTQEIGGKSGTRVECSLLQTYTAKTAKEGAIKKETSKFKIKIGDLSFSVEPTAVAKLKLDKTGLHVAYLAVNLKEELGVKVKAKDLFEGGKVERKLGRLLFPTSVPGLQIETALYLNISADGTLSFTLKADSTLGFSYKESNEANRRFKMIAETKTNSASVEAKAELSVGLDVTPSINLWGLTIADASLSGDYKLGTTSKDVRMRNNGLVCSSFKLKRGMKIEVGKHDSLMKTMFNLSWEKKLGEDKVLKNWHMENGRFVSKCTWKGDPDDNAESIDDCTGLIIPEVELPTVQEIVEKDFSLPSDQSVLWIPIVAASDCAGVEVSITNSTGKKFDAPLCYGVFTGTGENATCVAEKGLSLYGSYPVTENNSTTLGLGNAGSYYLRVTNSCYVNPNYYDPKITNVSNLHIRIRMLNNDANENNNSHEAATQIKRGVGTMFRLLGKEDLDVFCFKAPSAGTVAINVWGQGKKFDSQIGYTIFRVDNKGDTVQIGNLGVSNYASYAFDTAKVKTFDVPSPGLYYVKVANAYYWNPYYYSAGRDNKTPLYISYDFVEGSS